MFCHIELLTNLNETLHPDLYAKTNQKPFYFCTTVRNLSNKTLNLVMDKKESTNADRDGLPPFVSSWPQLYKLLIATLVVLIALFYLFMTHFE